MRTSERSATPSTMSSRASVKAGTGASSDRGASTRSVLEAALRYNFFDPELLVEALSHRSWCAEHGGPSNERLEFLGDAVLGLMVAELTYRRYPEQPEGQLAKIRASVVSARSVADTARIVSLGDALLLGRGEAEGAGRDKDSILSDALEAVLGAVYLDGGYEAASEVVGHLFHGGLFNGFSIIVEAVCDHYILGQVNLYAPAPGALKYLSGTVSYTHLTLPTNREV